MPRFFSPAFFFGDPLFSRVCRRHRCFFVASGVSNALFSKFRLILVLGVDLGVIGGSAVYAVPLVE